MRGKAITTKVDGQVIAGKIVFLRFNDITVEITWPFSRISTRAHIPGLALPLFQYERDGHLTERGLAMARRLLADLYDACCFVETNEEALREECNRIRNLGRWALLISECRDCGWHPLYMLLEVLLVLATDMVLVEQCRQTIEDRFNRWLPEALVRWLLEG
jgi:hypothetical protein